MMVDYLAKGFEVAIAVSLIAGIIVGSAMGIAGFGSIWVFRAEMLALLVGGAIVLLAQSALVIEAAASVSLRAGLVAGMCFFLSEPVVGLVTVIIAIAVAYLVGKITGKWTVI
jgi:hypothetical protein